MDKAIEKIAQWIVGQYAGHSWSDLSPDEKEGFRDDAREILKLLDPLGFRQLAKDQGLPKTILECERRVQQDMLTERDGTVWAKIKVKK